MNKLFTHLNDRFDFGRTALSFDDVLMVPGKTSVGSRNEIDLTTKIAGLELKIPIISANMPSISDGKVAGIMANLGGLGIIHRMCSLEEEKQMVSEAWKLTNEDGGRKGKIGASIGIGDDWLSRTKEIINLIDIICIDVAHAHQDRVLEVVRKFRREYSDFPLIVGNIATPGAASDIFDANNGTQNIAVKVGVGGGSMCTTRVQTGHGIPTFQSTINIAQHYKPEMIIFDGGIKSSGDIVKGLAFGNAAMIGSLIAGCEEAPSSVILGKDGLKYKVFRGSASYGSKKEFFNKTEYIEGVETLVRYKGHLVEIIEGLVQGIKSGLSYSGANNLSELREKAKFVQITPAGLKESLPHGLL